MRHPDRHLLPKEGVLEAGPGASRGERGFESTARHVHGGE